MGDVGRALCLSCLLLVFLHGVVSVSIDIDIDETRGQLALQRLYSSAEGCAVNMRAYYHELKTAKPHVQPAEYQQSLLQLVEMLSGGKVNTGTDPAKAITHSEEWLDRVLEDGDSHPIPKPGGEVSEEDDGEGGGGGGEDSGLPQRPPWWKYQLRLQPPPPCATYYNQDKGSSKNEIHQREPDETLPQDRGALAELGTVPLQLPHNGRNLWEKAGQKSGANGRLRRRTAKKLNPESE